jgi:hypothetical protein
MPPKPSRRAKRETTSNRRALEESQRSDANHHEAVPPGDRRTIAQASQWQQWARLYSEMGERTPEEFHSWWQSQRLVRSKRSNIYSLLDNDAGSVGPVITSNEAVLDASPHIPTETHHLPSLPAVDSTGNPSNPSTVGQHFVARLERPPAFASASLSTNVSHIVHTHHFVPLGNSSDTFDEAITKAVSDSFTGSLERAELPRRGHNDPSSRPKKLEQTTDLVRLQMPHATVHFNPNELQSIAPFDYSRDVDRLIREWTDPAVPAMKINGVPVPLKYVKVVFSHRNSTAWTVLKQQYSNFNVGSSINLSSTSTERHTVHHGRGTGLWIGGRVLGGLHLRNWPSCVHFLVETD